MFTRIHKLHTVKRYNEEIYVTTNSNQACVLYRMTNEHKIPMRMIRFMNSSNVVKDFRIHCSLLKRFLPAGNIQKY